MADSAHSTGNEPKNKLSEDSDKTPINDPNHDNISDFSRVTREDTELFVNVCVDPSVLHGVLTERSQFPETGISDPLFSPVPCDGNNVLPEWHHLRETDADREREKIEKKVHVL